MPVQPTEIQVLAPVGTPHRVTVRLQPSPFKSSDEYVAKAWLDKPLPQNASQSAKLLYQLLRLGRSHAITTIRTSPDGLTLTFSRRPSLEAVASLVSRALSTTGYYPARPS